MPDYEVSFGIQFSDGRFIVHARSETEAEDVLREQIQWDDLVGACGEGEIDIWDVSEIDSNDDREKT